MTFLSDPPAASESRSALDTLVDRIPPANALGCIGALIPALTDCDVASLSPGPQSRRAYMIVSFLAHSFIWSEPEGISALPEELAVPWLALATRCGLPPVLTYSSYVLDNVTTGIESPAPIPAMTFTGGPDEIWFVRVHQQIETAGAPIVDMARRAARDLSTSSALRVIADALGDMCHEARRMQENCDPYVYFHRVRRYLFGWQANPLFRGRRMRFEGVDAAALPNEGQYFGESGAQSPLLPLVDRLLNVRHTEPFATYTLAMRAYMYPEHRELVDATAPLAGERDAETLAERERALEQLHEFRAIHLDFAQTYILDQEAKGREAVGTGGSFVLTLLSSARDVVASEIRALRS